jgi:hypothetical protein
MIKLYRAAARTCTEPVGSFVNNQVAYFTFVHCADRYPTMASSPCSARRSRSSSAVRRPCRKKLKTYVDLGIDRLMCLHQIGNIADFADDAQEGRTVKA